MESVTEFIKRKREDRLNTKTRAKDIKRKGTHLWKVEAITFMPETGSHEKVFVIERFSYFGKTGESDITHKIGTQQYRIGYWIVGKNGNKKDKWAWGQFAPIIPVKDLSKLIKKAEKEGTIT